MDGGIPLLERFRHVPPEERFGLVVQLVDGDPHAAAGGHRIVVLPQDAGDGLARFIEGVDAHHAHYRHDKHEPPQGNDQFHPDSHTSALPAGISNATLMPRGLIESII